MGIGSILGGIGKSRSESQQQKAQNQLTQDQLALQRWQAEQQAKNQAAQLELAQKQFGLQAPGVRLGQSVRGSLAANAQPGRVSHPRANVVQFRTGLESLSPETRAMGAAMTKQALMQQLAGDSLKVPTMSPLPQPTPLPKSSIWDKILGVAGMGSSLAAGIGSTMGAGQRGGAPPSLPYASGIDPIGRYGYNMSGLYQGENPYGK